MKIKDIEQNVEATLAVENKKASTAGKKITREFLEGKISSKEAVKRIKSKYLEVK